MTTRTLTLWRLAFTLAAHAFDRWPNRLTGIALDAVDARFYDECLRATPMGPTTRSVDAVADTMPAPCAGWDCLGGEGPALDEAAGEEHAAMVDLHGEDCWPHSGDQRKGWIA